MDEQGMTTNEWEWRWMRGNEYSLRLISANSGY